MTRRKATPAKAANDNRAARIEAFTFGDPEPVLSRAAVLEHIEVWANGRWYEPPVSLAGLARTFTASPHHSSAIIVKRQMLVRDFIPHRRLSRGDFEAFAFDYLTLANGYLEERRNRLNERMVFRRAPAKYLRRGIEPGVYFQLNPGALGRESEHEFPRHAVTQLMEPDLNQELYGVPGWLSALQGIFLNEGATLFRRRYYLNGSHAGYILYSTDVQIEQADVDKLRTALKESKGPGNFRNVFLHAPGGKKDGLQLIPVAEAAAKDEFLGIKNTSRDDILAAHRVPPQLLGVVPQNTGGFGKASEAADVFHALEILPLQGKMRELNELVGEEVVRFKDWTPLAPAGGGEEKAA